MKVLLYFFMFLSSSFICGSELSMPLPLLKEIHKDCVVKKLTPFPMPNILRLRKKYIKKASLSVHDRLKKTTYIDRMVSINRPKKYAIKKSSKSCYEDGKKIDILMIYMNRMLDKLQMSIQDIHEELEDIKYIVEKKSAEDRIAFSFLSDDDLEDFSF